MVYALVSCPTPQPSSLHHVDVWVPNYWTSIELSEASNIHFDAVVDSYLTPVNPGCCRVPWCYLAHFGGRRPRTRACVSELLAPGLLYTFVDSSKIAIKSNYVLTHTSTYFLCFPHKLGIRFSYRAGEADIPKCATDRHWNSTCTLTCGMREGAREGRGEREG